MEIISNNLLDNIIYRANIFNYDNKFLSEIRERNLKLDLNIYSKEKREESIVDISASVQFLRQKSKDQLTQMLGLIAQKEDEKVNLDNEEVYEEDDSEVNTNLNKINYIKKVNIPNTNNISYKEARSTLLLLLDVISFSKNHMTNSEAKRLEEMENMEVDMMKSGQIIRSAFSDNILYCLLYIDGLAMFNIDIVRKLSILSPTLGVNFPDILFEIINNKFLEDNTKEIASHLLSAELSFVDPENVPMTKWKELMYFTFNYYTQK
jgi:hypothetical protein